MTVGNSAGGAVDAQQYQPKTMSPWWGRPSLTTWGFALALAILVLVAILFIYRIADLQQRAAWMESHQQAVLEIDDVLLLLKDVVLGQRGYAITGEDKYLDIYREANKDIYPRLESVERLIAENPLQQRRIGELRRIADAELAAVDISLRLKAAGSLPDSPEQIAATEKVRQSLVAGRALLADIRREESDRLAQRVRESQHQTRLTIGAVGAGYALGLTFLLAAFTLLKRQIRLRTAAEAGLQQANEHLERRIRDRTADLARSNEQLSRESAEHRQAREEIAALNDSLEIRVAERTAELQAVNKELESFSYTVSHDLRAPLRAVDGFARILEEDHGDRLDAEGRRVLGVIRGNSRRMGDLIDDLLTFSRTGRKPINAASVDMEALSREVAEEMQATDAPATSIAVRPMPPALGDRALLRQVWSNLLANAVKFTQPRDKPVIEAGGLIENGIPVYYVRDNGVGFDMRYADKLFGVFQRLHAADEFPGTGVGLAIVHRVVTRHGGRIWAQGQPNEGATFYFTLIQEKQQDG